MTSVPFPHVLPSPSPPSSPSPLFLPLFLPSWSRAFSDGSGGGAAANTERPQIAASGRRGGDGRPIRHHHLRLINLSPMTSSVRGRHRGVITAAAGRQKGGKGSGVGRGAVAGRPGIWWGWNWRRKMKKGW